MICDIISGIVDDLCLVVVIESMVEIVDRY